MYFDSSKADTGIILLGAVDSNGYDGTLYTLPILSQSSSSSTSGSSNSTLGRFSNSTNSTTAGRFSNATNSSSSQTAGGFTIALDSISFTNKSGPAIKVLNESVAVTLDTGFTGFVVTEDIYDSLVGLVDSSDTDNGIKLKKCPKNTDNVTFTFSGAELTLKYKDLTTKRKGKCYLDIQLGDTNILGNSFLKNVYAVYDLEDREVSLAVASFSGKEDISEIDGSIPGATNAPGYSSDSSSQSSNSSSSVSNSTRNQTRSNSSTSNFTRLARRQISVNAGMSAKSTGILTALLSFAIFSLLF